jgi:hypothetical protein
VIVLRRPAWRPAAGLPVVGVSDGVRLVDLVAEWLPEFVIDADDGTLYELLDCICSQVGSSLAALRSSGSWFDPAVASPDRLPLLAAIAGVDLAGVPPSQVRQRIVDPRWRSRGAVDVLTERVRATLTGGQHVTVTTTATTLTIHTFTAETPDAALTAAVARAEAPAHLVVTVSTTAGMTYDELAARYPTYAALHATGKTYRQLTEEAP